jgi:hypothetical protein
MCDGVERILWSWEHKARATKHLIFMEIDCDEARRDYS